MFPEQPVEENQAFRAVAENELCRHATGFVKMGHIYTRVRNRFSAQVISEINFNKLFFVPIINKNRSL